MRQGLIFVSCVWALAIGCKSEPLGVEGWAEAQRAAAESVCGCASALGRSVESCLDDFDVAEYDNSVGFQCMEEALAVAPEGSPAVDCYAESFWKLDRCASSSSCEEGKTERCIDEHEVRVARCPTVPDAFVETQSSCADRFAIARDPATRYVNAVQRQHGRSYAWRDCVLQMFEVNEAWVRDYAVCAVPHIDRYNTCEASGEPTCQHLLTPSYACPPMVQELLDWQAVCDERY